MPRVPKRERINTHMYLDPDIHEELGRLATQNQRSFNNQLNFVLRKALLKGDKPVVAQPAKPKVDIAEILAAKDTRF